MQSNTFCVRQDGYIGKSSTVNNQGCFRILLKQPCLLVGEGDYLQCFFSALAQIL